MVVVSSASNPVVSFQDPGTGTSSHKDPNSAAMISGPLSALVHRGARVHGMDLEVDATNNTITVRSGVALLELPSTSDVQTSPGGSYDATWNGSSMIAVSIDETLDMTADNTAGYCDVYLNPDPSANDTVEIVNIADDTVPADVSQPYIRLGSVNTDTGSINQDVYRDPGISYTNPRIHRYLPEIKTENLKSITAQFGRRTYMTYGSDDISSRVGNGETKFFIDDTEYSTTGFVTSDRIKYTGISNLDGPIDIQGDRSILDGLKPSGIQNYLTISGNNNMASHCDHYNEIGGDDNLFQGAANPSEITLSSGTSGNVVDSISGKSPNITDNGDNTIGVVDKDSSELSDLVYEESLSRHWSGNIWTVGNFTELNTVLSNARAGSIIYLTPLPLDNAFGSSSPITVSSSHRFIGSWRNDVWLQDWTIDAQCQFENIGFSRDITINADGCTFKSIEGEGPSSTTLDLQANNAIIDKVRNMDINNGSGYTGHMIDLANNITTSGDTAGINVGQQV